MKIPKSLLPFIYR